MNPSGSFTVSFSGKIIERMRTLMTFAVSAGCGPRVHAALCVIEYRLGIDPRTWGDPVRHFPAAEVMARRVVHDELAVEYAVHDRQPLVWVTKITPVLGHPARGRDEEKN